MSRRSPLVSTDAASRYAQFLASYPALANRIPLAYLASYIGVTPQSLSRLRRQGRRCGGRPAREGVGQRSRRGSAPPGGGRGAGWRPQRLE